MEEGKKKIIMIVVIVVCFAAAGIIYYKTHSSRGAGSIASIERGTETVWVKCRDCGHTWQMDKRDYFEYLQEHRVTIEAPPIVCPKCGKESGYRAEKCEKCGFVFERGAVPGDFSDRCPKCGYSAREEARKKRKEARSGE